MSGAAYAHSPAYGVSVALGPVQRAVLDVVLELTQGGRRPSLTLGRLSALTGRPISSVHDAIGRLRDLGLIGAVARMGRIGGVRFWRVTERNRTHKLDPARHRVAIARLVRRWYARVAVLAGTQDERQPPASPAGNGDAGGSHDAGRRSSGLDPFGVTPKPWSPPRAGETFAEKMKRYGIGSWIDEKRHGDEP
jgi:hypothetical protein